MWEIAAEVEPPAINDLMATTLGGIALGRSNAPYVFFGTGRLKRGSHVSPASFWEP